MDALISRLLVARTTRQISPDLIDEVLSVLPKAMTVREREAARNRFLRQAVDAYFEGSPWQRCEGLARCIRQYCGHPVDPVRQLIWQAEQTGAPLLRSADSLYRVLYEKNNQLLAAL